MEPRDNFQDAGNVTLLSTANYGVSHARNTGIENSSGEYVMFLDSDDELLPGAISFLFNALEENYVDIACGSMTINQDECLKSDTYQILEKYDVVRACLVVGSWFSSACAKLFKKSTIGETRFDEQLRITEDGQFVFDICVKMPRVYVSNTFVYYYRCNCSSVSKSGFSAKYFDMIYTADCRYNYIRENFVYLTKEAVVFNSFIRIIMLKNLCRTGSQDYREQICEYQSFLKKNRAFYQNLQLRKKIEIIIFSTDLYWVYRAYYRVRFGKYLNR